MQNAFKIGGLVIGVSGTVLAVVRYKACSKKQSLRRKWDNAGENVVVLHQFPRPGKIPSLSPFPIKLETYLRAMDIEYVCDFEEPMSGKQKCPWITFNGVDVADSQLAIEFLAKTLEKDIDSHLTLEEAASARAIRIMIEDHFYWGVAVYRWVHDNGKYLANFKSIFGPLPGFLLKRIRKKVGQLVGTQANSAGLGRHSREDLEEMCCKDLKAVSTLLGSKKFMMGENLCLLDCTIFGFLCQVMHGVGPDCVYKQLLDTDCTNLKEYMTRVKNLLWHDWDSVCT